jgi:hypothetical protein
MAKSDETLPRETQAESGEAKGDLLALVRHVQERPGVYIGAAAFVAVVLIATGIYRGVQASALKKDSTAYVRAIETEDPAARSAALAVIAESDSALAARALYLEGESALSAGDYGGARKAFEELRDRHPDFEFVPDAAEGIGYILEDSGDFAGARGIYGEVASKWPDSAAAQRQPFNVARCFEGESNLPEAVAQYRKQLDAFAGSTMAVRAQQRLNELRTTNPELFAGEEAVDTPAPVLQELTGAPASPAPDQLQLSIDAPGEDGSETTTDETPAAAPGPDAGTPPPQP